MADVLAGKKWRSFANSLYDMLKLRSTPHEVAWQFNNLAYSSGPSQPARPALFRSQTSTCPKTAKNSYPGQVFVAIQS